MDSEQSPQSIVGTIIGVKGGLLIIKLESGEEVYCRGLTKLHRPMGFFRVPLGRLARISVPQKDGRMPVILAVLPDPAT